MCAFTGCRDKRPTKADVRLCYYAGFLTTFGNEMREEVEKVAGNVNASERYREICVHDNL